MGWFANNIGLWFADASTVESWDRRVAAVDLTALADGELRNWYSTALAENDATSAGNKAIIAEMRCRGLDRYLDRP
jgi:hypothetical protein